MRANAALRAKGYGLLIYDGYRPWYVTEMFWEATPDDKKIFVADPTKRIAAQSRLRRGPDTVRPEDRRGRENAQRLRRDERSAPMQDYAGGAAKERERRAILRAAMEKEGFTVYHAGVVALRLQGLEVLRDPECAVRGLGEKEVNLDAGKAHFCLSVSRITARRADSDHRCRLPVDGLHSPKRSVLLSACVHK